MQKWEYCYHELKYKTVFRTELDFEKITELGKEGWELVSVMDYRATAFFKRPVEE